MRASVIGVLLCVCVMIFSPLDATAAEVKRVLLLHSSGRELGPFDVFTEGFREELDRRSPVPLQYYEAALEPQRAGEPVDEPVVHFLQSMFADRSPDLIVSIGGPASRFATAYRQRLFPATSMLLAAVDQRHLRSAALTSNDAAAAVIYDAGKVIDQIRTVLPQTRTVFVVIGDSPLERFWREDLGRELQRFQDQVTFIWGNELSFSEMLKRCATLPPNSAIFYALLSVDAAGFPQTEEDTLSELHKIANAPIFGLQSSQMGRGVVGGPLMSINDLSRNAAGAAIRILNNESPAVVRLPPQRPGPNLYDWRELRRWNIDEDRLPSGSIVQFREPTLWQRYKWYVLASALVCFIEAALISSLLVNLGKRRRAERMILDLGKQLLRAQEAERARLARELHDDITQRLAKLALDSGRVDFEKDTSKLGAAMRKVHDEIVRLSEDVHSLAYRLHPALLERLGLANALKVECEQFSRQIPTRVNVKIENVPVHLPQDLGLCLFRVTQEALRNVSRHARAAAVDVSLQPSEAGLRLTVVDNGVGFHSGEQQKRPSLGLASMQERVRLLGGKMTVESEPGRGTALDVWVPFEEINEPGSIGRPIGGTYDEASRAVGGRSSGGG